MVELGLFSSITYWLICWQIIGNVELLYFSGQQTSHFGISDADGCQILRRHFRNGPHIVGSLVKVVLESTHSDSLQPIVYHFSVLELKKQERLFIEESKPVELPKLHATTFPLWKVVPTF